MAVKLILWDFGDTLADERWMLAPMVGAPDWPKLYHDRVVGGALGLRWNTGAISTGEVAAELAGALGVEVGAVIAHMEACSRRLRFFPKVMSFIEECAAPQAIVTVNPDIFTNIVVPEYQLDQRVDLIVTSWQQGTEENRFYLNCRHPVALPRTAGAGHKRTFAVSGFNQYSATIPRRHSAIGPDHPQMTAVRCR
jgi:hypothetical protein